MLQGLCIHLGHRQLTIDITGTGVATNDRGYTTHEHLQVFSLINMKEGSTTTMSFLRRQTCAADYTQSFNATHIASQILSKHRPSRGDRVVCANNIAAAVGGQ
jgi:hypothetical protein